MGLASYCAKRARDPPSHGGGTPVATRRRPALTHRTHRPGGHASCAMEGVCAYRTSSSPPLSAVGSISSSSSSSSSMGNGGGGGVGVAAAPDMRAYVRRCLAPTEPHENYTRIEANTLYATEPRVALALAARRRQPAVGAAGGPAGGVTKVVFVVRHPVDRLVAELEGLLLAPAGGTNRGGSGGVSGAAGGDGGAAALLQVRFNHRHRTLLAPLKCPSAACFQTPHPRRSLSLSFVGMRRGSAACRISQPPRSPLTYTCPRCTTLPHRTLHPAQVFADSPDIMLDDFVARALRQVPTHPPSHPPTADVAQ